MFIRSQSWLGKIVGCAAMAASLCGELRAESIADAKSVKQLAAEPARGFCGSECDFCWFGTVYEFACPTAWCGDFDCDCGCQFSDVDCPGGTCGGSGCGPECTFCWIGTAYQNDCPANWCDDGDCDCGCQFTDLDCGGTCSAPCELPCEWCWEGTSKEQNCPRSYCGTDDGCDCGCQFVDPDCPGGGTCPECSSNSECSDELFCNGSETCSGGFCTTATVAACATNQCCNEIVNSCGALSTFDMDRDCYVTAADFAAGYECFWGPGRPPQPSPPPSASDCLARFDVDQDNDVDLRDVAAFQRNLD